MNNNKKKLLLTIGCPLLAVVALGLGGYFAWVMTPPAMPQTVDDVESLFASRRYQRLSKAEQVPYLEHVNEMWSEMKDEADRRRLRAFFKDNPDTRQDAVEQGIRTMYRTMVLDQDEAGRNMMLDVIINKRESDEGKRRQRDDQARMNTPEGQERKQEGIRRMMQWLDQGDPQALGYGSEFVKMLQNRRQERGLSPF